MNRYIILYLIAITISSGAAAQNGPTIDFSKQKSYSNTIDIAYMPGQAKEQAVSFSDMGAWHGITIPTNNSIGIGGPYLVADHLWAGSSMVTLTLKGIQGENILSKATCKNTFYPGLISQSQATPTMLVSGNSFFISNRTTMVMATITNSSNATITVTPRWEGGCFAKAGVIASDKNGIGMKIGTSSIRLHLLNGIGKALTSTDSSYTLTQNEIKILAGQSIVVAATLTYLPLGEQLTLTEQQLIDEALANPLGTLTKNELRWNGYIGSVIRCNNSQWNTIAVKSIMTLVTNWKSALADLPFDGIIPSIAVNYFDGFWAWDSWKHAAAIAPILPDLAKDQIRAMFSYQDSSGMIIDCIYPDKRENNSRDSKPPLAAWAVWETFIASHDTSFVIEMLPKLKMYHQWWYTNRDHNQNGVCEFGSCDGTLEAAGWESGMDNAVRFDSSIMIKNGPNAWSLNQESVDLNSFLYLEKQYIEKMCLLLKEGKQAMKYSGEAKTLRDSIRVAFWHEPTGYFYDRVINTNSLILEQGSEGWHPLWACVASKEQVDKVAAVMLDSSKFNTFVPFPTLAINNPKFDANGYWRGPVWLDQVYFAIEGLRRNGHNIEADKLTERLFTNLGGINGTTPIHENYQPANGKGIKAPNFSWSAAHLLMLYSQYGRKP